MYINLNCMSNNINNTKYIFLSQTQWIKWVWRLPMMNSGVIPEESSHSGAIPPESGHSCGFRCHSGGITGFRTESVGHCKVLAGFCDCQFCVFLERYPTKMFPSHFFGHHGHWLDMFSIVSIFCPYKLLDLQSLPLSHPHPDLFPWLISSVFHRYSLCPLISIHHLHLSCLVSVLLSTGYGPRRNAIDDFSRQLPLLLQPPSSQNQLELYLI